MKGTDMKVHERFIDYIRFDTTSDPASKTCPSTRNQMIFAEYLVEQMKNIGIENAHIWLYKCKTRI
jgi:tripeptide aminopeptidase